MRRTQTEHKHLVWRVLKRLGSIGPQANKVVGDLAVDVQLEFRVVQVAIGGNIYELAVIPRYNCHAICFSLA